MQAAVLEKIGEPLQFREVEVTPPGAHQVLVRNSVCGVCRTDLHIVDGELADGERPIIPGHQIVGHVADFGSEVTELKIGDRVGIPWLGWTCGGCNYCLSDQENLCDFARFTGFHVNGGFAEYAVADARYCFPIDSNIKDEELAPLFCAGLIGYRAFRMIGNAKTIAFYGFGSAAHILLQVARYKNKEVYAVTRPNDVESQKFALQLGAEWAGGTDREIPVQLDAAIIFAPAGYLVPLAMKAVRKGGCVVCAGIHMSDIPSFPYEILWGERILRSVANLTRKDGIEFLKVAAEIPIRSHVQTYPLMQANDALADLRKGRIEGSAVIDLRLS